MHVLFILRPLGMTYVLCCNEREKVTALVSRETITRRFQYDGIISIILRVLYCKSCVANKLFIILPISCPNVFPSYLQPVLLFLLPFENKADLFS